MLFDINKLNNVTPMENIPEFQLHKREGFYFSALSLNLCNKKQESYAAIFISCSVDADKNAFKVLVNFTPLSVN